VCQIIELCGLKGETLKKAHKVIDEYADRGLRSLGVARQVSKGCKHERRSYYIVSINLARNQI